LIRVQYEVDAVFSKYFELASFPFDCQDFTMLFKLAENTFEEADLLPFPRVGEFFTLDRQVSVITEWKMENLIAEFFFSDPRESRTLKSYPLMALDVKASRVWRSYTSEFGLTFCMFILGLGTFAQGVDSGDLGNRLAYCVVFLLADVTTIQMVAQKLPEIQYITLLDGYTWACFGFLFSVTMWSSLAGALSVSPNTDHAMFWFALVICLIIQTTALCVAYQSRQWERKKLTKTHAEVKEHIKGGMCFKLRNRPKPTSLISLEWDKERFLGEVKDFEARTNAFAEGAVDLVALGNTTQLLMGKYEPN